MPSSLRNLLHRCVPSHFHDPIGLFRRLMKQQNSAVNFALWSAGISALATPVDLALSPFEKRLYRTVPPRRFPLIFVCGPPRSGTTLVYQTLVQHLPVAYLSNLMTICSRSPLTVARLSQRFSERPTTEYESFYGRTNHWSGTNDALNLWDRWFGHDRSLVPESLSHEQSQAMQNFFAACEQVFEKPLVNKNNSLNHSAHLVAEHLENAYFICLNRSRTQLAQSLYKARCDIHGSPHVPYGISEDAEAAATSADAARSVCRQVLSYERLHLTQQKRLGKDRFWNINYEDFCRNPTQLVRRVACDILGDESAVQEPLPSPFVVSHSQKVSDEVAAEIECAFGELMPLTHPSEAAANLAD